LRALRIPQNPSYTIEKASKQARITAKIGEERASEPTGAIWSDLEHIPHLRANNNTFFNAKTPIPITNRPIWPILEQSTNQSPAEVSNRPISWPDCSLVDW
jgi:hypothetical protein